MAIAALSSVMTDDKGDQSMRTLIVAGCIIALTITRGDAQCPGDFNGDGTVSINELITAVNSSLMGCPTPGPRFTDNGDGTVTDTQNGLMWEKLSFDLTIHDVKNMYTWDAATTTKIATLNSHSFAGHTDWRLPTIYELETVVDYGQSNPATDAAFNHHCEVGCKGIDCSCTDIYHGPYWTSTDYAYDPAHAWGVAFGGGGGFISAFEKTEVGDVRAVRTAP
jgi:hypothetical protein